MDMMMIMQGSQEEEYQSKRSDWSRLERACRQGDVSLLEQQQQQESQCSLTDFLDGGATILLALASRYGHLSCVQFLIQQQGVDVNALGALASDDVDWGVTSCLSASLLPLSHDGGATPLFWASAHGQVQVVDALLQLGADPNLTCPLAVACQQGHVAVVQRLLRQVTLHVPSDLALTLNCRDAIAQGQILSLLLDDDRVDAQVVDNSSCTLLHKACQRHDARLVELVATHSRHLIDAVDQQGRTALAMVTGSPLDDVVVQCLLFHGANPCVTDPTFKGFTPLHKAVQSARLAQVRALLSSTKDLDVNAPSTSNGQTPLMQACHEFWQAFGDGGDMKEIVRTLLRDSRLDVNRADDEGRTVLHHACTLGLTWMVELILASPSDVFVQTKDVHHQTPLHEACRHNHLACVQLLLRHGACLVTPRDATGQTPFSHALLQGGHCVQLLYFLMREHNGWIQLQAAR